MNALFFLSSNVFAAFTRRFGYISSRTALLVLLAMILLGSRAVYATTYTVTDTADNPTDTGSLRYAVNNAANGDTINFASSVTGTIYLSGSTLEISNNVTINGPGANFLAISGANGWTVFTIDQNATVNISGLTISEGGALYGAIPGAGIVNAGGTLTLNNVTFSDNWSGLYNGTNSANTGGVLIVNNCTFSGNNANVRVGVGGIGAGMNINGGTVTVTNSTFSGNTADQGAGMSIDGGTVTIYDSTISGNSASSFGAPCADCTISDGGISVASPNMVTLINSIVAGNTTNGVPGGDCDGCGTQSSYNLIGGNPELAPMLMLPGNVMPTMLPLPGSPAIQAGNPAQLPAGLTTDERGFPRLTGGKLDLGAAQTNYTSIQFVQQPTNTVFNATIAPPVTVEVLETNTNLSAPNNTDPVYGIPITLTFNGDGTLGGTLTQITTGGGASFGDLSVNTPGTGDTLATTLTVTPEGASTPLTLTATSDPFNIVSGVLQPQTITFTPPTSVTYGTAPIVLSATATSGLPVTFQVDSGPGTLSGDTLTFTGVGTVVVEADQAGNSSYQPATPVVANITVQQANAGSFSLSANPSSLVLGQDQTGTSTFTVTPQNNYSGTVSLSCSGLPANTTCTFTPSTVTLTGNGKAMTSQLSVMTHSSTANLIKSGPVGMAAAAIFWLPGMLLGGFLGLARKKLRSKMRHVLLLSLMVAGMLSTMSGLTGCGGGSGSSHTPSVPVGSYTVTITAAAGSLMQSTPFTLTITD